MPYIEVTLSDGKPCKVRRLSVFGLDGVGPDLPGPFRYKYEIGAGGPNAQMVEDVYDTSARKTPPKHPGLPRNEIENESPEWWDLLEFETYKAAIAYEVIARLPSSIEFVRAISAYVARHCIEEEDVERIQSTEDWGKIYRAACVPQVTKALLAKVYKEHFSASYKDEEILDAVEGLSKGSGKADSLRQWEHDAMAKFGYKTEDEWADVSLEERARKMASVSLPQMLEALQVNEQIEKAKRKGNG
jgi:hypothetical protein